uniref:Glycosyltransferase family 1 protein n=1 Tax=candidate division WOR-3 bacterium TaxID=2052148 RepID=A0A7V0Z7J8_UNCW3
MNVVFAADYIASSPGAFIRSLTKLGKKIIENRGKVAFLFSEKRFYLEKLRNTGIVYVCNNTTNRNFSLQSLVNLTRAVRKIKADIIHIHFVGMAYLIAASLLKFLFCYKLIVHWRCIPDCITKKKSKFRYKFSPYFYNFLSKRFIDANIVISKAISKILIEHSFSPQDKVYIIYNGVDPEELTKYNYAEAQVVIEKLIDTKVFSKPIVGMVADYSIEKDHKTFIKAADLVRQQNPDVIFLIVGSERKFFGKGIKEDILRMIESLRLKENVFLIDKCLYATEIIPRFDIGVLCSHNEGLGNVIIEYMMAGVPVIGTNTEGIGEVIHDGVTGYLISPGRYNELADRIIFLLKNSEVKIKMGINGKKYAEEKFSLENWIKNIINLYNKILDS